MKLNKPLSIFIASGFLVGYLGCDKTKNTPSENPIILDETPFELSYGNLSDPIIPEDNPLTVEGVKLGQLLFFEKRMSKDESQACGSCHIQKDGFSDIRKFSVGVEGKEGGRQAMAIFNMAWHSNQFFWDGRANLLRDQALMPIQDPLEMNESLENVVAKLSESTLYKNQFIRAFGSDEITPERISFALEQYMMSLISANSKYDQFKNGTVQLTASEERGRILFETEYNPFFPDQSGADCAHCHGGENFENDQYMNNGLDLENEITDLGREMVTKDANDRAKFKVPSLRNVAVTPPYMHDGRFKTLEEVVEHYNSGIKESNTTDPALMATKQTGLMLSDQDKIDLVNFLKTLTDDEFLNNPNYQSPF